ncbi:MAG: zinc-binding alcohol dehydrogenase family protein [Bacteroidia bacterium]|nr:MAG: zinc-binding alcohol dehydrogenase family protein [Bacteroidia bacterium]
MKAVHIEEAGKVAVVRLNKPVATEGELLLRLRYVGFCGSDLSSYLGKNPMVEYPRVPGHEISALIEEVGEGVPEDFSVGEAVTVMPYTSCGHCPSCLRERSNACQFNQTLGVQRDGAMQEYLSVPWQKVLKAPGLGERELAMVEPLTVGFHAVERGRVSASDVVMVLGCGMIGAGAIVSAVQKGATVIAVDIDDHKLELASELGARHTINSRSSALHEELVKLTGDKGPEVVVEAAGNPVTYRAAVEEVAFTGRVVCIGYAGIEVAFATKLFVQKEMDILGSRNATAEDFRNVIAYLYQGTFPMKRMLSRVVKVEEAGEALKAWARDPGRIMKILVEF